MEKVRSHLDFYGSIDLKFPFLSFFSGLDVLNKYFDLDASQVDRKYCFDNANNKQLVVHDDFTKNNWNDERKSPERISFDEAAPHTGEVDYCNDVKIIYTNQKSIFRSVNGKKIHKE